MYEFKLLSSHLSHLNNTRYSCSLSCLYEKLADELPALNWFQRLSRPNVALQRAMN